MPFLHKLIVEAVQRKTILSHIGFSKGEVRVRVKVRGKPRKDPSLFNLGILISTCAVIMQSDVYKCVSK